MALHCRFSIKPSKYIFNRKTNKRRSSSKIMIYSMCWINHKAGCRVHIHNHKCLSPYFNIVLPCRHKQRHISAFGGTELLLQCSVFTEFMTVLSPPDCYKTRDVVFGGECCLAGLLYWIILACAGVDIVPTLVYKPGKQLQHGALLRVSICHILIAYKLCVVLLVYFRHCCSKYVNV